MRIQHQGIYVSRIIKQKFLACCYQGFQHTETKSLYSDKFPKLLICLMKWKTMVFIMCWKNGSCQNITQTSCDTVPLTRVQVRDFIWRPTTSNNRWDYQRSWAVFGIWVLVSPKYWAPSWQQISSAVGSFLEICLLLHSEFSVAYFTNLSACATVKNTTNTHTHTHTVHNSKCVFSCRFTHEMC